MKPKNGSLSKNYGTSTVNNKKERQKLLLII